MLIQVTDNGRFLLAHSWPFKVGKVQFTIPIGFETDFASVPFGFRNVFPKIGPYARAAVMHDYLCVIDYDAKARDEFFLQEMEKAGVPWWKRMSMFAGVRSLSLTKGAVKWISKKF